MMSYDQQFTQLLIDAVCGVGFPSLLLAQECERVGLADYTAGAGWAWDRRALAAVSIDALQELYTGLCEAREENFTPTDPVDDYEPSILLAN